MFEFHSHLLHGTKKFTQGHTCDFSNNFGALEPVLVVQIWIMHIKCPETQLMYKKAKRTGMIPKFSTILLLGLICLCKKIRREKAVYVCRFAHGGDTFPLGTTSLLEGSSGLQEAYTKACPNSAKNITVACWCHVMTPCQVSWFSGVFWIYRN